MASCSRVEQTYSVNARKVLAINSGPGSWTSISPETRGL
jgi:hypothetical protein